MFGIFNSKTKKKEKIDFLLIEKMREFSNETEKSYKSFISYMQDDFPNSKITPSNYGIYKARFGTNLMIAIGAQMSKSKIGFGGGQEMFNDIQIASALAHEPFSELNSSNYLEKTSISKQTEDIIEYIVKTIKPYQDQLLNSKIDNTEEYFRKIKVYFHNCISESIEDKETLAKVIESEDVFFQNMTDQNLKILVDFGRI